MIFVPCAGGISHNEAESAEPEDLAAGCNVLLHAMVSLAGRADAVIGDGRDARQCGPASIPLAVAAQLR